MILRPGTRIETRTHPASVLEEPSSHPVAESIGTETEETATASESIAEAPTEEEVEVETAVIHWIRTLLPRQNEDGSWGEGGATLLGRPIDNAGITSLVLLAFLGAGYTHLNKDEVDGRRIGDAVRAALKWLLDQRPSGTLDQGLATLALSEAYGMTGSVLLQGPAQSSVDALLARQAADGSWHDPVWSLFGMMALKSAEIGGLTFERDQFTRAVDASKRSFESKTDLVNAIAFRLLNPKDGREDLERVLENASPADPAERYLWSLLAAQLGQRPKANSLDVSRTAPTTDVALGALRDCISWYR